MEGDGEFNSLSPFFSDYIYEWLENALDYGISEFDFWNMTLAEIRRQIESYKRVQKEKERERAISHYILANMIGISNNRNHSEKFRMPTIEEFYPTIFVEEAKQKEIEKQKGNEAVTAARIMEFAAAHNAKLQKKGVAE